MPLCVTRREERRLQQTRGAALRARTKHCATSLAHRLFMRTTVSSSRLSDNQPGRKCDSSAIVLSSPGCMQLLTQPSFLCRVWSTGAAPFTAQQQTSRQHLTLSCTMTDQEAAAKQNRTLSSNSTDFSPKTGVLSGNGSNVSPLILTVLQDLGTCSTGSSKHYHPKLRFVPSRCKTLNLLCY